MPPAPPPFRTFSSATSRLMQAEHVPHGSGLDL